MTPPPIASGGNAILPPGSWGSGTHGAEALGGKWGWVLSHPLASPRRIRPHNVPDRRCQPTKLKQFPREDIVQPDHLPHSRPAMGGEPHPLRQSPVGPLYFLPPPSPSTTFPTHTTWGAEQPGQRSAAASPCSHLCHHKSLTAVPLGAHAKTSCMYLAPCGAVPTLLVHPSSSKCHCHAKGLRAQAEDHQFWVITTESSAPLEASTVESTLQLTATTMANPVCKFAARLVVASTYTAFTKCCTRAKFCVSHFLQLPCCRTRGILITPTHQAV